MAARKKEIKKTVRSWINLDPLEKELVVRLAHEKSISESEYWRSQWMPVRRSELAKKVERLRARQAGPNDPLAPLSAV